MERINRIKKLINHRKAFKIIEKQTLGYNTIKSFTHDLDKLLLLKFAFFISVITIRKMHKKFAAHHRLTFEQMSPNVIIEKLIDWECARYTKSNSQMTAYEYFLYRFKGHENTHKYKVLDNYLKLLKLKGDSNE